MRFEYSRDSADRDVVSIALFTNVHLPSAGDCRAFKQALAENDYPTALALNARACYLAMLNHIKLSVCAHTFSCLTAAFYAVYRRILH